MNKKSKKRKYKFKIIYVCLDLLVSFGINLIAFLSFYGINDFSNHLIILLYCGAISILILIVFLIFKVYKIITKDIGLFECFKIMILTFCVQILELILVACIPSLPKFQDFIFTWLLCGGLLSLMLPTIRVFGRFFASHFFQKNRTQRIRTIVIGAGACGKVVIDESRRNKESHKYIVAIVDDDPTKIGNLFCNIPVFGPISNICNIIDKFQCEEVIIAITNISKERLHDILAILNTCNVRIRRMPMISEMEGPNDKRYIDFDLNDLLSREPIVLDNHEVDNMISNKCVLVTGAGGSIGSELVRQIFNANPKTLIMFDIYENSTYDIQMELVQKMRKGINKDVNLITLIGSTYNEFRVEEIFKLYKPDYVYHAAAYKHVPLMEDSPAEAIRTNVIGTYNVAKMADKYGTKKMVLVSTDKAVRPTNVMGATKRFAEMIIQDLSEKSVSTKYAAVRFGNVLGSNGSVVPLFKKQIVAGGPVTITDKDITRYFMTIPEAVSLILQCSLFADGGEIFILDMGRPVKIIDMAEKLIRQAGLIPGVDIKIIETGLRPGEKLYEELLIDTKHQTKTSNKKIFIEKKEQSTANIKNDIQTISRAFKMYNNNEIKSLLSNIVTSYKIRKEIK